MQLLSQILSARAETIRSVLLRLRVNLLFTAWRFDRRIPTPDGDYPMKKTNKTKVTVKPAIKDLPVKNDPKGGARISKQELIKLQ